MLKSHKLHKARLTRKMKQKLEKCNKRSPYKVRDRDVHTPPSTKCFTPRVDRQPKAKPTASKHIVELGEVAVVVWPHLIQPIFKVANDIVLNI